MLKSARQEIKAKKIGIYGGTFDPVHLGHVNLAFEIMEAHALDEVWFCPTSLNPFKQDQKTAASPEHRLKMLNMAIEGQPRFRINEIELRQNAPCYTIDTLRALIAAEDGNINPSQFSLIMGEDAAKNFYKWREAEEVVSLVPILIGARSTLVDTDNWQGTEAMRKSLNRGFTQTRIMEISSSDIRKRLSQKLYCGHLLQAKILDYILFNHLYL